MSYPQIGSRVEAVRERVARACERAGRSAAEVTVVGVTKTHPAEAVEALAREEILDIGENKVQELDGKAAQVTAPVRWHLIGHLQRNKAKRAVELAHLIHSVDSLRLAAKLSDEGEARGTPVDGLVQVNLSGEETKGGLEEPGILDQLGEICELPGLRVRGLMTMAPFTEDEARVRGVFSAARELSERARQLAGFEGAHLSMGMSNDFELAIEEGSTLIRLGTVLLGERPQ